jgi:hypothetical protein
MSGAAVPVPAGAGIPGGGKTPAPASGQGQVPVPQGAAPVPSSEIQQSSPIPQAFDDPGVEHTGYYMNGDGNMVIAPKEGENFADTLHRATAHWKSLTPEEQKAAIDRETSHPAKKVAGTLGTAAAIGAAGPAALAAVGEGGAAAIEGATNLVTAPLGGTAPIVRALPHIVKFAEVMGKMGIGAGSVALILKELMAASKE